MWTKEEVQELKKVKGKMKTLKIVEHMKARFGPRFTRDSVQKKLSRLKATISDVAKVERENQVLKEQIKKLKKEHKFSQLEMSLYEALSKDLRNLVPALKSKSVKQRKQKGKIREHLVIHLSDEHADQIIEPKQVGGLEKYNFNVALARAENYVETLLKFTQETLSNYYFPTLWILAYGDHTSGEIHNLVEHSQYKNILKNCIAIGQMHALMIKDLAPYFKEIKVLYLSGNHPRRSQKKDYNRPTNSWDYLIAQVAKISCKNMSNVDFIIPDSYHCLLDINGFGFYIFHGDDVPSWNQIPWYGIERKTRRLKAINSVKGHQIDYFILGHFHALSSIQEIQGETLINGAWIGTTPYIYNRLSGYHEPYQLIHGVHKKHGVSWRLPIKLKKENEAPKRYSIIF